MEPYAAYPVRKLSGGAARDGEALLAREAAFTLRMNGAALREFACSPGDLRALAAGFVWAERGLAPEECAVGKDGTDRDEPMLELTAPERPVPALSPVPGLAVEPADFAVCADALLRASAAFEKTGCIHAAGLFRGRELCWLGEDVSRLCALYKALGKALLAGERPGQFLLCTTGRLSGAYLEQVIRSGIGAVVSRSAPTDRAAALAARYGVSVAGFAGGGRADLYRPPEKCSRPRVDCCILAGGLALRAGGADKSQFRDGENTFLNQLLAAFKGIFKTCYLSYNRPAHGMAKVCSNRFGGTVSVVPDLPETTGKGPMGGVYSVLSAAPGAVFFVPCDLPRFPRRAAEALAGAYDGRCDAVVLAMNGALQPLCGIYSQSALPALRACLGSGEYRMRALLERLDTQYVEGAELGMTWEQLRNVNTLSDLETLQWLE